MCARQKLPALAALAGLVGLVAPLASGQQTRAWQQAAPYRAPDFEAFFPDDVEGGAELDVLWDENRLRGLGDEEFIEAVFRGLRRTTQYRTSILSRLGNRFIWGKDPQNPDAIEICYHAADFSEKAAKYGTRHYAVYFGLSVVNDKPPAVLRTLADLCVAIDDPNDIGRVAWGAKTQIDELLPYLDPHLTSDEAWVREKAEAVRRIFRDEIGAFEWGKQRAKEPKRLTPWVEMPEVRAALSEGSSEERLAVLERIREEDLTKKMNDSYLVDFAQAALDLDPKVRAQVTRAVGRGWVWGAGWHLISADAVDLLLALSRDADADVRYDAVYYGLSNYQGENDAVLRRMLDMALDPSEERAHSRLLWGIGRFGDRSVALLEADLASKDIARARAAYDVYWALFDEAPSIVPPGIAKPADLAGTWFLTVDAPAAKNQPRVELRIDHAADGTLTLHGGSAIEGFDETLTDFVSAQHAGVLHFQFSLTIEGLSIRTAGRLENGRLIGTTQIEDGDRLYVWSATKEPAQEPVK